MRFYHGVGGLASVLEVQSLCQTSQMIELCCEYLSVRCIWLYVIIMSHTSFRVNPHSIVCLSVKELLVRSRRDIWNFGDSNVIRTHNHLVCKRTFNHLANLAKWLSRVLSTYLYGAFDHMLLSCHVRVSEWIHTLQFVWMSRTSQVPYLKTQPFGHFGQMVECLFTN